MKKLIAIVFTMLMLSAVACEKQDVDLRKNNGDNFGSTLELVVDQIA